MWEAAVTIVRQLLRRPGTNIFPAKYAPESTLGFLDAVARQQVELHPPVTVPPRFRGKIVYDRENCIGCQQCYKICPTHAIEWLAEEKKIRVFMARCCFCAQCVDVCPVNTLAMTEQFLLASYDKYDDQLVILDSGELPGSKRRRKPDSETAAESAD